MFLFGPPNIEKMKARRDVRGLIRALKYDKDWIRCDAAYALGDVGDARAVKPLISILKDREFKVRQAAIVALGRLGDARAVQPLATMLEDKQPWGLRKAAVWALGKIGNTRALSHLIDALTDPQQEVRETAVEALRGLGALAVEQLIAALSNSSLVVRRAAAETLGKLGDSRAIEPLIAALKDSEWSVRKAAAESLEQIGDVRAVEPLIALLKDDKVCYAAARALKRIGDARAVQPLTTMLKDRYEWVREIAADALDRLGWQPGQDESAAWYWMIRGKWQKCVGLGELSIEPLNAVLREANFELGEAREVRERSLIQRYKAAIDSLDKIGGIKAVESLLQALEHHNWEVRYDAAKRLVYLYHHGKLPEETRHRILMYRERIMEPHHVDYDDCGFRSESGIGVYFPL
ncbi:MAG: hypothetical protein Fur0043_23490 [Anaerolineales bacterium]